MAEQNDPDAMEQLAWREAIQKGRKLARAIQRASWTLGDLALELFPPHGESSGPVTLTIGGEVRTLSDFADAIEFNPRSLSNLRSVSHAWPGEKRRADVSWSTHRALMAHPDRFNLIHQGMKRSEANDLMEKLRASSAGRGERQADDPTAPVKRALVEARTAVTFVSDKRRKFDPDTREALTRQALELRQLANQIMSALDVQPQAGPQAVEPEPQRRPWQRFLPKAA